MLPWMKHTHSIRLLLISLSLSACGSPSEPAGDAGTVYHVTNDTLVNPKFPAYSFAYPSYWDLKEEPNHTRFASEAEGLRIELFFINLTLPGLRAIIINT